MAVPATWRPPWFAWTAVGFIALALTYEAKPGLLHGRMLVLAPIAVCAGVLVLRWLWHRPPAVAMCAAIALSIFSGAWGQIGLGGVPLDRLLLLVVLMQFLLRAPGVATAPRPQVRNVHLLMGAMVLYAVASAAAAQTLSDRTTSLLLLDQLGAAPYLK
jgi:hypothetical protein